MVDVMMVLRNKCCTGSLWRSCASHDLLGAHRCIISADHNLYGMVGATMVLGGGLMHLMICLVCTDISYELLIMYMGCLIS